MFTRISLGSASGANTGNGTNVNNNNNNSAATNNTTTNANTNTTLIGNAAQTTVQSGQSTGTTGAKVTNTGKDSDRPGTTGSATLTGPDSDTVEFGAVTGVSSGDDNLDSDSSNPERKSTANGVSNSVPASATTVIGTGSNSVTGIDSSNSARRPAAAGTTNPISGSAIKGLTLQTGTVDSTITRAQSGMATGILYNAPVDTETKNARIWHYTSAMVESNQERMQRVMERSTTVQRAANTWTPNAAVNGYAATTEYNSHINYTSQPPVTLPADMTQEDMARLQELQELQGQAA